ncbi:hypothetical protein AAZV13_08G177850 [Glycine max]|nr:hypothetical protein JHK87_021723 [Glycine soja]
MVRSLHCRCLFAPFSRVSRRATSHVKLVTKALQKMKGKIPEIVGSHILSRVLQTCVKHCSQAERDAVFEELWPHFLTLAYNAYPVHSVKKMLNNSNDLLEIYIVICQGHLFF